VSRPGSALAPGKGPSVPIVQEVGWAPEVRGKILSPLPGIEPLSPGRVFQALTTINIHNTNLLEMKALGERWG
jgi:hypothetical protein